MTLWPKFVITLLIVRLYKSWTQLRLTLIRNSTVETTRRVYMRGEKRRRGRKWRSSGRPGGRTRSTTSSASPRPLPPCVRIAFYSRSVNDRSRSRDDRGFRLLSRHRRVFFPPSSHKRDLYLFLNDGSETVSSSSDVSSRERRSCGSHCDERRISWAIRDRCSLFVLCFSYRELSYDYYTLCNFTYLCEHISRERSLKFPSANILLQMIFLR